MSEEASLTSDVRIADGDSVPRRRQSQPETGRPSDFREILSSPHYERLRARLIRIFAARGSSIAEELADETIARVVAKIDTLTSNGNPAYYFYAVARNVYLESTRKPRWSPLVPGRIPQPPSYEPEPSAEERIHDCLEDCLSGLDDEDRYLITAYYRFEKAHAKKRRELADELGLSADMLRLRALRIRRRLGRCLGECAGKMQIEVK